MTSRERELHLQVADEIVAVPAASVAGLQRLSTVDWSGEDAAGSALALMRGDDGPWVVRAAPALLPVARTSPSQRWAVRLRAADGSPQAAVAVCAIVGLRPARNGDDA